MDAEWTLTTLEDVIDALDETLAAIEADPDAVATLLPALMPAVYAKLNYAWNSRHLGPAAIDTLDHDALIGFPQDLPL